jgi:hypothetical protein
MCETPYNASTPREVIKVHMQVRLQESIVSTIHPSARREGGLATRPIEVDVLARLDFAESRVTTHRAPDLFLELAGGDVVAEEGVVCHPLAIITLTPQEDVYLQHTNRPGHATLSGQ